MPQFAQIRRLLLAFACCLLLPAWTVAESPAATSNRGLFYEVTDGSARLYLFGTVHAGKAEFYPFNAKLVDAFNSSRYLALEIDVSNQAAVAQEMAQYATYTGGDSLARHISPALMGKLQPVLEQLGLPIEFVGTLKPWTLATMLDLLLTQQAGYTPEFGADAVLAAMAKEKNKHIAEIESMRMQIQIFESFTPAEQEIFLANTVDEIASGEGVTELKKIVEAWGNGDTNALTKAFADDIAQLPPQAKFIDKKLIKDRNGSMTERIDSFLHSGNQYFVAIGAGHLVGGEGVVERLRAKGYKVRDLQQ
jgi:uncharacterized protein YbaP (TraB family)